MGVYGHIMVMKEFGVFLDNLLECMLELYKLMHSKQ
jgi:hypothetical protein